MSDFFIAYSGRNIEKVSAIMYFLSEDLGANNFWFAPSRSFDGQSVQEALQKAIQEAKAVVSFESGSTYRIMNTEQGKRDGLSRRALLLLYEREEAERLNKRIVNVAIKSPGAVGLNAQEQGTFNLSMSLQSKEGLTNMGKLISYLREI